MTATTMPATVLASPRPRLLSRPLVLASTVNFAGLTSFYLLLSVVPQFAAGSGAAGGGVGLTTAALMLTTVAAEFVAPRLASRFGHRSLLAAGLILLGAPALVLPVAGALPMVVAVCLLRGVGLAIIFVVCGALSAALIPAERRGEGLGVLGLVAGVPAVVAMPAGVWLAGRAGFAVVFVIAALAALAGLAAVAGLPGRRPAPDRPLGMLAALRTGSLVRPSVIFAASATAVGVVVTFLPDVMRNGDLAATALLVQAAAATAGRWWAGRHGDRHGAGRLLVPGVIVAAVGMCTLVAVGSPVALLAGMALLGLGFGVVQNASIVMMYERVNGSGYGVVSALWNVAYDAGLGAGAAGFGLLAGWTGYPVGFAAVGALMLAVLVLHRRR